MKATRPIINKATVKEYALAKSNRNAWHETPINLLEFGMCLCDSCGEVAALEDEICHACGEQIVIFKKTNK